MELRDIKDITIVGGGTAGWLTALYVKTVFPTKKISLIESDKIGILGAGEGSTPPLISFLDILQIPVSRLVKDAGVTIKNGIKFTNWHNGGESDFYYHPFAGYGNCAAPEISLERLVMGTPAIFTMAAKHQEPQTEWCFVTRMSEQNKVGFKPIRDQYYSAENPIYQFEKMSSFSLHFDARKLAAVLSEIGQERGIKRVEGIVSDTDTDADGFVTSLKLDSGEDIPTDFVFDCTGFKSFFAKKFESKWVSASKHLTVNAAMPFFLEPTDELPPYTESIAMKYGWMWKIPLQERYGCGYVFNSDMIDDEEAKAEIVEWLGYEPEWPREKSFSWDPGYLEEPWTKNVITAGLSAGFVEPLEATSIWTTVVSWLGLILGNPELLHKNTPEIREEFNKWWRNSQEEVIGFVYYHYMGGRTDTEFWTHYTEENAPKNAKKFLDINRRRSFLLEDFDFEEYFEIDSWSYIFLGHKDKDFIENNNITDFYSFTRSFVDQRYDGFKKLIQNVADYESLEHREFLDVLKKEQ